MKCWNAIVAIAAALSVGGSASASANANVSSSSSGGSGAHHGGSTTSAPSVAPAAHFSAIQRRPGAVGYRAVVNYSHGNRTLNYPAVGVSTQRHSMPEGRGKLNSAYTLQRNPNSHPISGSSTATKTRLDPQTSTRLRNWNGNIDTVRQARLNHADHCHHHHDRWWWRNHCVAFIFFDWGWWGWYDGWWYPAWGYDPYSYYQYNEPIYGYDGESPEQIVAGVQAALQERGYYQYAVDGRMGPLTRAAMTRYQRDHGLPITSGIDPATLGSLGIIR